MAQWHLLLTPLPSVLETSGHLQDGEEPQLFPLASDLAGLRDFGVSRVQQPLVWSVALSTLPVTSSFLIITRGASERTL